MSSELPNTEIDLMLQECEGRIGYQFRDRSLLQAALTHASGAIQRLQSNERLEFLGDSILGFVVCELLFEQFPDLLEGEMTRIKSAVVSRVTCATIGKELGLTEFLLLGKGMDTRRGLPTSLVANAFESIIAAIYIDGGLDEARKFILQKIPERVDAIVNGDVETNFKSTLQQYAQRQFGTPPTYQVLDEQGPDHDKSFQICAQIAKQRFSPAWGNNKKEAEQRAAGNALAELDGREPPYASEY